MQPQTTKNNQFIYTYNNFFFRILKLLILVNAATNYKKQSTDTLVEIIK